MALSDEQRKKIEEEEKYRAMVRENLISQTHKKKKNKATAAVLAIFLGAIGAHKFYLGRVGWGILYAVFFWAWIPLILGVFEGIIYLTMSDKSFQQKYS